MFFISKYQPFLTQLLLLCTKMGTEIQIDIKQDPPSKYINQNPCY